LTNSVIAIRHLQTAASIHPVMFLDTRLDGGMRQEHNAAVATPCSGAVAGNDDDHRNGPG